MVSDRRRRFGGATACDKREAEEDSGARRYTRHGSLSDRDVVHAQARREMTPRYVSARAVSTQTHQDSLSDPAHSDHSHEPLPDRADSSVSW